MISSLLGPDREPLWAFISLGIFLFLFVMISLRTWTRSKKDVEADARLPLSDHEERTKP